MASEVFSSELIVGIIIGAISAIISSALTYAFSKRKQDAETKKALAEAEKASEETKGIALENGKKLNDLLSQVDTNKKLTIEKKGSEAYFYSDDFGHAAKGVVYQEAQNIIKNARKEVLVLWAPSQYDRSSASDRNNEWKQARDHYYSFLMDKCRNDGDFKYSRYLQLPEDDFDWAEKHGDHIQEGWITDLGYRAHCREILTEQLGNAGLYFTKQITHESFVLIDRKIILIEIDVHNFDKKTSEFESVIVIEDTNNFMTNHIYSTFFNHANQYAKLVNGFMKVKKKKTKKE